MPNPTADRDALYFLAGRMQAEHSADPVEMFYDERRRLPGGAPMVEASNAQTRYSYAYAAILGVARALEACYNCFGEEEYTQRDNVDSFLKIFVAVCSSTDIRGQQRTYMRWILRALVLAELEAVNSGRRLSCELTGGESLALEADIWAACVVIQKYFLGSGAKTT